MCDTLFIGSSVYGKLNVILELKNNESSCGLNVVRYITTKSLDKRRYATMLMM